MRTLALSVVVTVLCVPAALRAADTAPGTTQPKPLDFNRDVRPILSNYCYTCHGPDDANRQADLRFDRRDVALAPLPSGNTAVVPGDLAHSELWARVSAAEPEMRMPPADSPKQLSAAQIETLRRWIAEGALWNEHWSLVPPIRPTPPKVSDAAWPRNAIDRFILARLDREGLKPSAEADRAALARRVTLDLTGLPPTLAELDAFLADQSPTAYEDLVERLLASPHYGEHLARDWLDAARYGDTHGLHLDNLRQIWPYRNWVIDAFNNNKSFDQFTVEQIAGDLLPNRTLDQQIATGFNRCNVTTSEGGSIDAEYYVRYAVDRVETTSVVFMAATMGCAVCHDHKYDPFTQKDFYQLFSYFYSLTEKAMDGNIESPPPSIRVPQPSDQAELARLEAAQRAADARLTALLPEIDAAQAAWEATNAPAAAARWTVVDPLASSSTGGATLYKLPDLSLLAEGANPATDTYEITAETDRTDLVAVRLEALTHESLPHGGPGRSANANFVVNELELEVAPREAPDQWQRVALVSAAADFHQTDGEFDPARLIDGVAEGPQGWAVAGFERRENRVALVQAGAPFGFPGGTRLRFRVKQKSPFEQHTIGRLRLSVSSDPAMAAPRFSPWSLVGPFEAADGNAAFATDFGPEAKFDLAASYAIAGGERNWSARPDLVDGAVHELPAASAAYYLHRTIDAPSAGRVTFGLGTDDAVKLWVNGRLVLDKNVQRPVKADEDTISTDLEVGANSILVKVVNYGGPGGFTFRRLPQGAGDDLAAAAILAIDAAGRNPTQTARLQDYFRTRQSPAWTQVKGEIAALQAQAKAATDRMPQSLVMEDMREPRQAHILIRGAYDKPGEAVEPGTPAVFPPLPADAPKNRLALARWLVSPDHPLVARVAVNRYWQHYFGTGIVKTSEDFGAQGEPPSHPELLDWLATEFRDSGWDIKHIQRLIVTSATYRQSSRATPDLLERDPDNRLLARGPRVRLDAESIRDVALASSGLLVPKIGGPSVRPYQPPGLWEAVGFTGSNTATFAQDHGEALYRRSLYTFWKRTSPPPSMQAFDAPTRESCTVHRARTNTPLQALVLLNDVQFVEAARHLAQRALQQPALADDAARAAYLFRTATSRAPTADELAILLDAYQQHLKEFIANRPAAEQLVTQGESARDTTLPVDVLAAWTMVANLVLNLDETITKG